jgi:2-iminobutanoate/2-iminopropanoate deaminase
VDEPRPSAIAAQPRRSVTAPDAPAAIGPYSHAVSAAGLLFCSGQVPLDPVSGELVGEDAAQQAERCLLNLQAVCAAAGTTLASAVRITVYMTDLACFGEVNEVYASFFSADPPARVTVEVSGLPRAALIEIDAVVALERSDGAATPDEDHGAVTPDR